MSRRGENIYKRKDGRWEGRYPKGRKETGQLKYGYVYGSSYKEIKYKVISKKNQYQEIRQLQGEYAGTVTQWLRSWMLEEVQPKVKLSTYASYQHKIQTYILPGLGDQSLNMVTAAMIQSLVASWKDRGLSTSTMRVIFRILNKSFEAASHQQFIFLNPCNGIELPRKPAKIVRSLTVHEQNQLETAAEKDKKGLPVLLALHTGLRMGEIAALKWENIDFEDQIIHVTNTYQRIPLGADGKKTQLVLSEAKTQTSVRDVPFSCKVKEWLLAVKREATAEFVFSRKGKPVEPRLITYHFQRLLKKTKLKDTCFHQLRHTFATRCMEAQSDVSAISALLGHASAKTTLDIYTDSLLDQRRKVISAMERLVV